MITKGFGTAKVMSTDGWSRDVAPPGCVSCPFALADFAGLSAAALAAATGMTKDAPTSPSSRKQPQVLIRSTRAGKPHCRLRFGRAPKGARQGQVGTATGEHPGPLFFHSTTALASLSMFGSLTARLGDVARLSRLFLSREKEVGDGEATLCQEGGSPSNACPHDRGGDAEGASDRGHREPKLAYGKTAGYGAGVCHHAAAAPAGQLSRGDIPHRGAPGEESRESRLGGIPGHALSQRGRLALDRLHEGAAPKDPLVGRPAFPPAPEGLDRGPPAHAPEQPTPLEVGAPPLPCPLGDEGPVASLGAAARGGEPGQDCPGGLPGVLRPTNPDPLKG